MPPSTHRWFSGLQAVLLAVGVAACAGGEVDGPLASPASDAAVVDGSPPGLDARAAEGGSPADAGPDGGPTPNALSPGRIVVLGSSTAAGAGPSNGDDAWVRRYQEDLATRFPNMEVVNLAVGGFTTYQIQPTGFVPPDGRPAPDTAKNITAALALSPDAIVINMPSNDQASAYALADVMDNFDRVTDLAAAAAVPCWVTTTQPRDNISDAGKLLLFAGRDAILATYGPRAIDFWTGLAEADGRMIPAYNSGDGIHLNGEAHAILAARAIAAGIPEAIAVP